MEKQEHTHFWFYPHNIIQGRNEHETVIVRYCECGVKQMARVNVWKKATGDYRREEHYELSDCGMSYEEVLKLLRAQYRAMVRRVERMPRVPYLVSDSLMRSAVLEVLNNYKR